MHHHLQHSTGIVAAVTAVRASCATALLRPTVLVAALATAGSVHAFDLGPFSLTGFAKAEIQRGTNICEMCQREPNENRHRQWADDLVYGKEYGTETNHVTLFQPYLGVKFDLPEGFKISGLWSQRYRDGNVDIPGFTYEANVAIAHEEYGRLQVGATTTRSWSVADYPYGTNVGVSDPWANSGAGYGLAGHALRYTSRRLDVLEGDLVLEVTYDTGDSGWERNKPHLWEFYAQYVNGDLVVDAMIQDARNGQPVAWGHAPFSGLTAYPEDDRLLGESSQGIVMLMSRYQVSPVIEVMGGIRFNRWSGAYAVQTTTGTAGLWNNMFNVDWDGTDENGVPNPGYSARSTDLMLGLRYRMGKWIASAGLVYLGEASTDNPEERGQSNTLTLGSVGLSYAVGGGLEIYGLAGMVRYGRQGLAPLSMPSNNAFTFVDPRVETRGNWFGAGAVYTF
jgi:predicted porin